MFKTYRMTDKVFCYHVRINKTTNTIDSVAKLMHSKYCEKEELPAEFREVAIKMLADKGLIFEGVEY